MAWFLGALLAGETAGKETIQVPADLTLSLLKIPGLFQELGHSLCGDHGWNL